MKDIRAGSREAGRDPRERQDGRSDRISGGERERPVKVAVGAFDFEDTLPFNVGNWVIHPTLGRGQIREKDGVGPETKLTIRFDTGATKKIIIKYASLEPA